MAAGAAIRDDGACGRGTGPGRAAGDRREASYSRGMIAHASIATSCALARFDGRLLEVWSHTQGIFPLRAAIADALGLDKSDVVVHHVEGAGCYGHNPADDVAFDAALLACRTGGRPVRVLWDRAAELGWGPVASAMTADVTAVIDPDGSVRDWAYDVWSNGYNGRPGYAGNPGLLANSYRRGGRALPPSVDPPLASGLGSGRNAVPAYSTRTPRVADSPAAVDADPHFGHPVARGPLQRVRDRVVHGRAGGRRRRRSARLPAGATRRRARPRGAAGGRRRGGLGPAAGLPPTPASGSVTRGTRTRARTARQRPRLRRPNRSGSAG